MNANNREKKNEQHGAEGVGDWRKQVHRSVNALIEAHSTQIYGKASSGGLGCYELSGDYV